MVAALEFEDNDRVATTCPICTLMNKPDFFQPLTNKTFYIFAMNTKFLIK